MEVAAGADDGVANVVSVASTVIINWGVLVGIDRGGRSVAGVIADELHARTMNTSGPKSVCLHT